MFDHERLDVYKAAIKFVILAEEIIEHLPRGESYLADQLQRASTVVLNMECWTFEQQGQRWKRLNDKNIARLCRIAAYGQCLHR